MAQHVLGLSVLGSKANRQCTSSRAIWPSSQNASCCLPQIFVPPGSLDTPQSRRGHYICRGGAFRFLSHQHGLPFKFSITSSTSGTFLSWFFSQVLKSILRSQSLQQRPGRSFCSCEFIRSQTKARFLPSTKPAPLSCGGEDLPWTHYFRPC